MAPRPESPEIRRAKGNSSKRSWFSISARGTRRYSLAQSPGHSEDHGTAESISVASPFPKTATFPLWQYRRNPWSCVMTMHAWFSGCEFATGYLLKETALDENSVISRSTNLRREIDPWNGNFLGNWKLHSPQICLAFQIQASWRSGAGICSVENDCDISSVNSSGFRRHGFLEQSMKPTLFVAAFGTA